MKGKISIVPGGGELKTNSQGFRNAHNFSVKIPKGKIRIICCGDSFTLGYGVSNENTWCAQLSSIDHRLETINMGQGGYGIDQAYLWYMRDGRKLDHNIHLFTFITDDIDRMKYSRRADFGKPVLKLVNHNLQVYNVPVPKFSKLKKKLQNVDQFRLYETIKKISIKCGLIKDIHDPYESSDLENKEILLKIFEDLQEVNKAKKSILVLVYLPCDSSLTNSTEEANMWKKWLQIETAKKGIIFIDLFNEFKKMSFIKANASFFWKTDGHYTAEGNRFVAEEIYKKLLSIDETSKLLRN